MEYVAPYLVGTWGYLTFSTLQHGGMIVLNSVNQFAFAVVKASA
jgi:hypothetical protein